MKLNRITPAFRLPCVLVIGLACLTVQAQSGRRQTKPPPAAPVPTPTPEPTPIPRPKEDENTIGFLVSTGDRATHISRYPISFHDAALSGCGDRLRKRSSAKVDVSQREMSRGEAIKKAKAEQTTYVVLITIIEDMMSADRSTADELEVDYVVFAPGTAKVVVSGRAYENSARKGPLVVGPRTRGVTSRLYREQALRRAGEEAADRILKALHMYVPVPK